MNNKTYLYSEKAAQQFGAHLITLKDGREFYATYVCDANDTEARALYGWKDTQTIHICLFSEVASDQINERAKEVSKSIASRGVKGIQEFRFEAPEVSAQIALNSSFNNPNRNIPNSDMYNKEVTEFILKNKISVFLYSKSAAEKFGANLITLKDGQQFYTTGIFDAHKDYKNSYKWPDTELIYTCSYSKVLTNQQNEASKKYFDLTINGAINFTSFLNNNVSKEMALNYLFNRNNDPKGSRQEPTRYNPFMPNEESRKVFEDHKLGKEAPVFQIKSTSVEKLRTSFSGINGEDKVVKAKPN